MSSEQPIYLLEICLHTTTFLQAVHELAACQFEEEEEVVKELEVGTSERTLVHASLCSNVKGWTHLPVKEQANRQYRDIWGAEQAQLA
jgi:fructose 1,6-bisphosphatase